MHAATPASATPSQLVAIITATEPQHRNASMDSANSR